jgi:hypothetical protein
MGMVEKVIDEIGIIGDVQYLKSSNPDLGNNLLKILRVYSNKFGVERSDLIMFLKKGDTWRIAQNHCYISLESNYADFYSYEISLSQNVTFEHFVCLLTEYRKKNVNT